MRVFSRCFQLVFNIVTLQFYLHYFSTACVSDVDDNDDNIYWFRSSSHWTHFPVFCVNFYLVATREVP